MGGAARFTVTTPPPADASTRARLGRLELPHGVVETPQTPLSQVAVVQALLSSEQSAGVLHGSQPGIGVWLQPAAPPHTSVVQALPSSQRLPSSTWPSQSLSTPSHTSGDAVCASHADQPVLASQVSTPKQVPIAFEVEHERVAPANPGVQLQLPVLG